jgi:hypothetical protein
MALLGIVAGMLGASLALPALAAPFDSPLEPSPASPTALTRRAYLPLITRPIVSCAPTGETYGMLEPIDPATGDVSRHPDINLAVRGYSHDR